MDDREDELRWAIARERMARRILDAIAAEKLAKVKLFEEGIREQMRLHERLRQTGSSAWKSWSGPRRT